MSRRNISHNYEFVPGFSNALQNIASTCLKLKIRQQPNQTRLSTNNERDRRPLDPPPIVQIELENSNLQETRDFLQNPYVFMCATLVHPETHEDITSNIQNTLSGQTVSSMYKLKDINNHDGGFFVFGDLSVKVEGQFRLKFSMFEISQSGVTNLKSTFSHVFQVYSSKSFPGMLESTFLSRSFSDQGVRIRIRKEHRVQSSKKRKMTNEEDKTYERIHSYYVQPPSSILQPAMHEFHTFERRRSNAMSSDGRRPSYPLDQSIPFSPPHQPYDQYYTPIECEKAHHYQQRMMMIPSPPPTLFKPNGYRRLSMEDRLSIRRQSTDSYYSSQINERQSADVHEYENSSRMNEPRRLSLQHPEEMVHLPPLRSMISNKPQDGVIEVDAAVAMMELATKQQKT